MSMIIKAKENFLKELNHFSIKDENHFLLEHGDASKKKVNYGTIKREVSDKSGVYIYYLEESEEVLYVGKAKKLFNRIKCHYDESIFEAQGLKKGLLGDSKKGLYPAFFNKELKQGKEMYTVRIVWIEIDNEWERRLIEDALHITLQPKFLDFQEKFNIKNRNQT